MVSYAEWTAAVHTAYKNMGGDYGGSASAPGDVDIVQAITRAAARWWRENKETIVELVKDAAVKVAEELIHEYIDRQGAFP